MPISQEQLANIIRKQANGGLCSADGAKKVNELRMSQNYYDPNPNSFNDGYDTKFEAMLGFGSSSESNNLMPQEIQYNSQTAMNSSMPSDIRESMLNNKIDVSPMNTTSVLDSLNIRPLQKMVKKNVNECKSYSEQSSQIDYTIIKAIVSECIKEEIQKLSMLNENALRQVTLKGGKISLIDNSGNIYEAKLEKIGNKNNKQ